MHTVSASAPPPWWYNVLLRLALPVFRRRIRRRSAGLPDVSHEMLQRFAAPDTTPFSARPVWIHAVSVGETNAVKPLVDALLQQGEQILLTHTTRTGRDRSRNLFAAPLQAGQMEIRFMPVDTQPLLAQFLQLYRPKWVGFVETELWPNLLALCKQQAIPAVLLNGRLSTKSQKGYQRFARLTCSMLANISLLAVQNRQIASRFIALGADPAKVHVTGNLKFNQPVYEDLPARVALLDSQHQLAGRNILVAASTHEGEEAQIISAFKSFHQKFPETLLVIAPRHPERFAGVRQLLDQSKLPYTTYSDAGVISPQTAVYLLDTLGQLLPWYARASVAFVGGSMVPAGGHSPIEPAQTATAVMTGPHMTNFAEIVAEFSQKNALTTVYNAEDMMAHWQLLLELPHTAQEAGQRALGVVQANQFALEAHLALLQTLDTR